MQPLQINVFITFYMLPFIPLHFLHFNSIYCTRIELCGKKEKTEAKHNSPLGTHAGQHTVHTQQQHYNIIGYNMNRNILPHVKWSHYTNSKDAWSVIFWSTNFRNFCWVKVWGVIFLQVHNKQSSYVKIFNITLLSNNSECICTAMKFG